MANFFMASALLALFASWTLPSRALLASTGDQLVKLDSDWDLAVEDEEPGEPMPEVLPQANVQDEVVSTSAAPPAVEIKPEWDAIKAVVVLVGENRSGSSLIASLLDAHPRVVLPGGYGLMQGMTASKMTADKLFASLWGTARAAKKDPSVAGNDYDEEVMGRWDGDVFRERPEIIGGVGVDLVPGTAEADQFRDLVRTTRRPLKIINVVRNPFDNIATLAVQRHFNEELCRVMMYPAAEQKDPFVRALVAGRQNHSTFNRMAEECSRGGNPPLAIMQKRVRDFEELVANGKETPLDEPEFVSRDLEKYFGRQKFIDELAESYDKNPNKHPEAMAEVITVNYDSFLRSPAKSLRQLCDALGIHCSPGFVNDNARLSWDKHSFPRLNIKWSRNTICSVMRRAMQTSTLADFMQDGVGRAPLLGSKANCRGQCFPGRYPCPCHQGQAGDFAVCDPEE